MGFAEYFIIILFVILGFVSLIAGCFNFDWYFKTDGAKMFIRYLGRNGARIFYVLLGIALIASGILAWMRWK